LWYHGNQQEAYAWVQKNAGEIACLEPNMARHVCKAFWMLSDMEECDHRMKGHHPMTDLAVLRSIERIIINIDVCHL